jgi:predicted PolB exonuclease-like 3'-5' exonuclease
MVELLPETRGVPDVKSQTGFLVFDTESVPDGRLVRGVKYADEKLTDEEAIERAQREAREASWNGSDFLPASFQIPVSVCVAKVARDFALQSFQCLGAPEFPTRKIVAEFWKGLNHYTQGKVKLVSFNGRGFDFPLMEMAAFRYGLPAPAYYDSARRRFDANAIDLMEWFNNFGAIRHVGGVNLLAKLLGKPGKMDVSGSHVYGLWKEGRLSEINDYCMGDTLDTYFVFLRTCVMRGDLTLEEECDRVKKARELIETKAVDHLPR